MDDEPALGERSRLTPSATVFSAIVDVETRIGLVEDAQSRFQHRHLEDLVALFLAAKKSLH